KPITFVIPFAAGGDSDLSGRNVAQHASKYLNNVAIVPVNRTGASGAIATMAVKNAAPDGYTLLLARIATHAILPALESKLQYKWNEFTMLSLIEINPYICFVRSDSPFRTAAELLGEMRRNPGKLNFSTSGIGTSQNMAARAVRLQQRAHGHPAGEGQCSARGARHSNAIGRIAGRAKRSRSGLRGDEQDRRLDRPHGAARAAEGSRRQVG
ncbi:MAG: hypothetical protein E6H41_03025, partial [Betaproteobacteria bacterium]